MTKAVIWSKYNCPNCDQAKMLLKSKGLAIEERKIGDGYTREELLEAIPDAKSVPQIIIDETYVGGITELKKYLANS